MFIHTTNLGSYTKGVKQDLVLLDLAGSICAASELPIMVKSCSERLMILPAVASQIAFEDFEQACFT